MPNLVALSLRVARWRAGTDGPRSVGTTRFKGRPAVTRPKSWDHDGRLQGCGTRQGLVVCYGVYWGRGELASKGCCAVVQGDRGDKVWLEDTSRVKERARRCLWRRRHNAGCPAFRPSGAEAFEPDQCRCASSGPSRPKQSTNALQQGRDGPCVV